MLMPINKSVFPQNFNDFGWKPDYLEYTWDLSEARETNREENNFYAIFLWQVDMTLTAGRYDGSHTFFLSHSLSSLSRASRYV